MKLIVIWPLSNQVHGREKQERLVRGPVPGDGRVAVPDFVGPQVREHLGVLLKKGQVPSW
jgi:hypothetical protein